MRCRNFFLCDSHIRHAICCLRVFLLCPSCLVQGNVKLSFCGRHCFRFIFAHDWTTVEATVSCWRFKICLLSSFRICPSIETSRITRSILTSVVAYFLCMYVFYVQDWVGVRIASYIFDCRLRGVFFSYMTQGNFHQLLCDTSARRSTSLLIKCTICT